MSATRMPGLMPEKISTSRALRRSSSSKSFFGRAVLLSAASMAAVDAASSARADVGATLAQTPSALSASADTSILVFIAGPLSRFGLAGRRAS